MNEVSAILGPSGDGWAAAPAAKAAPANRAGGPGGPKIAPVIDPNALGPPMGGY